jgi:hypothetical protein
MPIYSVYIWTVDTDYEGWQIVFHDLSIDAAVAHQQFYEYVMGIVTCVCIKYTVPT